MESNDSEGKMSSSVGYKLVPWVNWDEWNYVRRSIFSSSPNLILAALQKISAWESRGCLPIAIDLTAVIIEIHQKDPFFRGVGSIGDALASEKMLNMLYCMFIMRLVNDFVEPVHKETGRSISDIADAIGIPRTLVDIRHESSHRCLPSLKLARSASAKALEWLKANYWEPQRIAVHDPRRKVKSRLREMILCSAARHVSRVNSTNPKRKYCKRTALLVACHKLSHINKRLLASKADVLTVQKVTKRAAHLYSLYPSEVVSLLLEIFLSQAWDFSDGIDMENSDDSDCNIFKQFTGSLPDLKMLITKLSKKKPRFLLNMLKLVLEMIEEKDSRNFEIDWNHFLSSQNQVQMNEVSHLRSLLTFLIRNLKALKDSGQIRLAEENQILSIDNVAAPKVLLSSLLHKCLTLLVPGDQNLFKSALLLSEMSGNRLLTEELKKLPLLAFLDQDLDPLATLSYNESMLLKEEDSIKKAEERLNLIKLHLLNDKNKGKRFTNNTADATTRWKVTKSWVACPIGTLPCSFSSTVVLPIFDFMEVEREMDKSKTTSDNVENVCAAEENRMVCDDNESSDDSNPVKMLKLTPQNDDSLALENPCPMQGRLLIGGVWKKVSENELLSLDADIRTFV
ncbi:uncharacterized protein LOC110093827 [Dendrobium catenatum]|uniref:Ribosomal biogenesis protein LAS1L n=1 Tax=Dendrobium catenatum TaxID=906689 RepID=A0A2I0VNI8_9ASPA|nr:uncharacterized protein LOC110093827 [Dendrobium catenatum]XP_028556382.1 uncharacterized protein LOC110093827 [Dendrobium catenatum]PKU64971.1 hypothetical protein MA16_Dca004586 [Dendrobium catenatum]